MNISTLYLVGFIEELLEERLGCDVFVPRDAGAEGVRQTVEALQRFSAPSRRQPVSA